jgi:hypothetical protein
MLFFIVTYFKPPSSPNKPLGVFYILVSLDNGRTRACASFANAMPSRSLSNPLCFLISRAAARPLYIALHLAAAAVCALEGYAGFRWMDARLPGQLTHESVAGFRHVFSLFGWLSLRQANSDCFSSIPSGWCDGLFSGIWPCCLIKS